MWESKNPGVSSGRSHGRFCALMKIVMSFCAFGVAMGLIAAQARQANNQPTTEPKSDKPSASKEEKSTVNTKEVAVIKTTEGNLLAGTATKVLGYRVK